MSGGAPSGVIKLWLHLLASCGIGAWISPLVYNAGKALAEVSSVKQTNGLLEWLAGVCRAADFPSFFTASIVACAVLFLLPLLEGLPSGAGDRKLGHPLLKNPRQVRDAAFGFLGLLGVLFAIAAACILLTDVIWQPPGHELGMRLARFLILAIGWALVQELWFRGVALGVFLRAMPPLAAVGVATVYFAIAHFLVPPTGMSVLDPDASGIGFELLGKIWGQFFETRVWIASLLPWLTLGLVLAALRLRTASLWLPLGIHSGWIFGNTLLCRFTVSTPSPLLQGMISVGAISLVGILAHLLYPTDEFRENAS